MILQALNRYYDILVEDPKTEIAPFGYSTIGVSFALNISAQGELLDILPQFTQEQRGQKGGRGAAIYGCAGPSQALSQCRPKFPVGQHRVCSGDIRKGR